MLVLSRKIGEQVLIPELGIYITVLSIGTNRVQLGITAPKDIQITRPEAIRRNAKGNDRVTETFANVACSIDFSNAVSSV